MSADILTVDFETYYDTYVGFKKLTTEEYIRHDQFHVIGVAVAKNDADPVWFSGTDEEIRAFLNTFDIANSLVLAHNTRFDGSIMSWRYGLRPKGWLDTLSMARAIHGVEVGGSLAALAERYKIGTKGTEVLSAFGMERTDFTPDELAKYGEYCCNDVVLCRTLFHIFMLPGLGAGFPVKELKVIDHTLRMFIEPTLVLNTSLLEEHLAGVIRNKEKLMAAATANRESLMSNSMFADMLKALGVAPPMKVSPTTGRSTYAFAKTDSAFKELLNHPDPRVQALVGARLGVKTTLEETRTSRFIEISKRGKLPVPIKYYAAHTGRWGGDDKINLQNLPARGANANKLKKAIEAPDGRVIIDCDSSQIEARIVAWLAGQTDLVEAFEKGEDVYKIMASHIYNKSADEITVQERFVGKTTVLGCGYGMGADKFQAQLKTFGVDVPLDECKRIISVYRSTYGQIPKLWEQGQRCIEAIISNRAASYGAVDAVQFDAEQSGFLLPSGLWLRYTGLTKHTDPDGGTEYTYATRNGPTKVYGGKVAENLCQALARCVIAEQMLRIAKKYKPVLTVHDAIAVVAREEEAQEARDFVESCMRWRPDWAATLPLNCESGMGKSYGDC